MFPTVMNESVREDAQIRIVGLLSDNCIQQNNHQTHKLKISPSQKITA